VSDSFNGAIWKAPPNGGGYKVWSPGPLLGPGMGLTPPFGANGVEFNNERAILFVADTAYHQIIQIPVNPDGSAGTASVFTTGINAPDGIMIDRDDNIWICSNQEDEIVVVDKKGKGDRKARRLPGHRRGRHRARVAIPGEPGLQQ
jgi:sugar lactone lactonase YvrE